MKLREHWDVVVIGGGFYGLYLAEHLARRFMRVLVCEREPDLMQRASYNNQARVHGGYHYPRSVLTALRSRANFSRFVEEFRPAICSTFESIYAIPRRLSKISAEQFRIFMQGIGAPIRPAASQVKKMFDGALIEDVFWTQEYAFDAVVLKRLLLERVCRAGVEIRTATSATRLRQESGNAIDVELTAADGSRSVVADRVFCCVYSQLNILLGNSGVPRIPLKYEMAEMALVELPESLRGLGVTVMDGPFFSCMPFPSRSLHTLSHVRYTPHFVWHDRDADSRPGEEIFEQADKRSAFAHMVRDAGRYLPALRECRYHDSLWEIKTLLPRSEVDDSRPILYKPDYGLRNLHPIIGGKIDNVYDVLDAVDRELGQ